MEVTRRETQKRAIEKIAAYVKNNKQATAAEYKVRRAEIEASWNKFQALHDDVVNRSGQAELAEQEEIIENVRELYLSASSHLEYYIERLSTSIKSDKTLALRQSAVAITIHNMLVQLTGANNASVNPGAISAQVKEIETLYKQFQDLTFDRIAQGDEQAEVFKMQETVRNEYVEISSLLHMENTSENAPARNQTTNEDIRLPPLQINAFDGNAEKWESFRDSFHEAFHVREMPAVQKLQHLKALVRGDAEELISNFSLTNANYEVAWNLLNRRYDNKKDLVRMYIRALTNIPKCAEKAADLRKLINKTSSTLLALKNLDRPVDQWDDWVVHHVLEKVDPETRKLWEQTQGSTDQCATWAELEVFIESRVRSLNAVGNGASSSVGRMNQRNAAQTSRNHHTTDDRRREDGSQVNQFVCQCCTGDHAIFYCNEFRNLTATDRRQLVADKRLCFNCLGGDHMSSRCAANFRCRFCDEQHNSLLHINDQTTSASSHHVTTNYEPVNHGHASGSVLLATAVVRLRSVDGQWHQVRALLDQGSQSSFISEYCAQLLNVPRRAINVNILGVGATITDQARHSVVIQMASNIDDQWQATIDAMVLRRVTVAAAHETFNGHREWPHLVDLRLADPNFLDNYRIDLLIGADIYGLLLRPEIRRGPVGSPVAQNTALGWIVSGLIKPNRSQAASLSLHCTIEDVITKFWEVEEVSSTRIQTELERACEDKFEKTFRRDEAGRFHVNIPFTTNEPTFGDSIQMAIQRQHQMERKFVRDPSFAERYRQFMKQYHELGHMELTGEVISKVKSCTNHYYIPHHAVVKECSTTTKLRVVFDASRKSRNGLSLNEQMHIGPRLQDDLSSIVLRWRKHPVVFTADVEQMYRQIRIDRPDSDAQRIVWRPTTMEAMQIFRLTTVTYGTASAPYLAVKSMQKLAQLEREQFPIGAAIAENDFYVDDVLSGCDNIDDALDAQAQLMSLMKSGGFNLRKWTSNCEELLNHLSADELDCRVPLNINIDQQVKTLGIQWNPASDCFQFKIAIPDLSREVTKRKFLSDAAKLYDPLGWLAPCVIVIKIMFQELWKDKLDWDDTLSPNLCDQWLHIRQSFQELETLRISRWIGSKNRSNIEIHGFCDASSAAYAAAVYVRVTSDDECCVNLLCAKTKVAPLKVLSIPRLELCSAVLLCKLMKNVQSAMKFQNVLLHCWTDSTIVLAWIKGNPARWNVFVGNRITEIQAQFPISKWRHVSTEQNPADCATRGVSPEELANHSMWWTGPPWLLMENVNWPSNVVIDETDEEAKRSSVLVMSTTIDNSWNLMNQISSWAKLARVTAYCMRFINNLKRVSDNRDFSILCPHEIQTAKEFWLKTAQWSAFHAEIKLLKDGKPICNNSSLRALNPTLHDDGLLHVGGRLINALMLPEQTKTPIIIPRYSRLSHLLIAHAHEITLHGGPSLMLAFLRRQFWIIDGPKAIRQHVKQCNTCFRFKIVPGQQFMAALPSTRITPSRPFQHTAMDYSGAVMVRSARGRGHHATKGYVAVFVCLCTKAVHIELVSDLTSEAFISAYKRFVGRRGLCSDLYSDNATNYVGAAATFLKTERELGFNTEMIKSLSVIGTKWHFSPPLSPHFNGLAESAIRSVKHHIRRILGTSTLTYEELLTVLIQIEGCLNSRPLYPCSSDPTDFDVLTPGHFLIGSPLIAAPQKNIIDHKMHSLTRWQLTQQMVQRFWKQWSVEYLHTLQQRKKWQNSTTNMKIGDLVLVIEDNLPPAKWALGRIIETHPGTDGCVRVVTIRTRDQTYKRAVVKLARLPTQEEKV